MSDSNVNSFTWLDYVLFSAMLVVSAATGLYHALAGDGQRSTAKFLMAERSMYSIPIAISVLASYLSAITILGVPSEVFKYGIQYWMIIWCYFIAIPLTALLYIPVFHGLGVTSAYEYLHKRFSMLVRICGAVLFILQTSLYAGVVLYAPALALEAVTKIPLWATVLVTGIVCTIYTALGGIKAVIWTDVFQFVVLFGSIVTILVMGIVQAGGISYIWHYNYEKGHLNFLDVIYHGYEALDHVASSWVFTLLYSKLAVIYMYSFNPNPTQRLSIWSLVLGGNFVTLPIWAISQISVQRFLTAKNIKEAQKSVWYGLPGSVIMITLVSFLGLVLFAFYNNDLTPLLPPISNTTTSTPTEKPGRKPHYTPHYTNADQILIYFVSEEFGRIPGIQGLFVSCLFAGTLSTVASGLNSLAAVTLVDIARPWRAHRKNQQDTAIIEGTNSDDRIEILQKQDEKDTFLSKIFTVMYGILVLLLALGASKLGSLIKMVNSVFGTIGGPLLGVFTLGMLYKRANSGGALVGLLAGFSTAIWVTAGALANTNSDGSFKPDTFSLYKMSFMWYSTFSCLITFIVGVVVSEVVRWRIVEERYKRVDPLLLASFLRPKGWHQTASGTETLDPDLQIGDPVIQSLLSSREEERVEEEEEEEDEEDIPAVGPSNVMVDTHEMESVMRTVKPLT